MLLALSVFVLAAAAPARAATISTSGATLTYAAGDGGSNLVSLKRDGAFYVFTDGGSATPVTAGAGCSSVDDDTVRCSAAGVTKLAATLGDGGDLFDALSPAFVDAERPLVPMRVDGGSGDDSVFGGYGDDVLIGGPGDDGFIHGITGSSNVTPTADNDVFEGGTGIDVVSYCCFEDMTVTLDGVANDGPAGRHDNVGIDVENVSGGWGDDTLVGSAAGNRLDGGPAGTDVLSGLDGDDTLGAGQGQLSGGDGNDSLGSFGAMDGGPGDDRLEQPYPGGGSAVSGDMLGGAGDDTLIAGPGDADVLSGGAGVDSVDYSPRGGDLTITLDGQANDGVAGEGDDVEAENLVGGRDLNHLVGDSGPNVLTGGPGDDVLDGAGGTDTYHGRDGRDVVTYASRDESVDATLDGLPNDGVAGEGENVDAFGDVEGVEGGSGDDVLVGNDGGNKLSGGAGDDDLSAGAATDFLHGGPGDDRLQGRGGLDLLAGDGGLDVASYTERTQPVTVRFDQHDIWGYVRGGNDDDGEFRDQFIGIEGAEGGEAGDVLVGDSGSNALLGSAGDDRLEGSGGDDELDGGAGQDRLAGGAGADDLAGGAGTDTVDYSSSGYVAVSLDGLANDGVPGERDNAGSDGGVENLVGSFGDDLLIGNAADNQLSAGGGHDAVAGGRGADRFDGGPGLDLVIYIERATSVDVALDGRPDSGNADDGPPGARDVVGSDVEDIWGGDDADRLTGNDAGNLLSGGPGPDVLVGGAGEDIADYSERSTGVEAIPDGRPTSGGPEDGPAGARDTIGADIEHLIGGEGADHLTGTGAENALIGLGGDDFLDSRDAGHDIDDCGDGNDRARVDALDETDACEQLDRPVTTPVPAAGGPLPTAPKRARIGFQQPKDLAAFLRRGLRSRVSCGGPCTIAARLTVDNAMARRLRLPRRAAGTVARRSERLTKPGDITIVLRVSKDVSRRLAKVRSLTLTLRVTVTQQDGSKPALRKTIRLRAGRTPRAGVAARLQRARDLRMRLTPSRAAPPRRG